jgi:hypothetical protein
LVTETRALRPPECPVARYVKVGRLVPHASADHDCGAAPLATSSPGLGMTLPGAGLGGVVGAVGGNVVVVLVVVVLVVVVLVVVVLVVVVLVVGDDVVGVGDDVVGVGVGVPVPEAVTAKASVFRVPFTEMTWYTVTFVALAGAVNE